MPNYGPGAGRGSLVARNRVFERISIFTFNGLASTPIIARVIRIKLRHMGH